jgi:hypothetical protein
MTGCSLALSLLIWHVIASGWWWWWVHLVSSAFHGVNNGRQIVERRAIFPSAPFYLPCWVQDAVSIHVHTHTTHTHTPTHISGPIARHRLPRPWWDRPNHPGPVDNGHVVLTLVASCVGGNDLFLGINPSETRAQSRGLEPTRAGSDQPLPTTGLSARSPFPMLLELLWHQTPGIHILLPSKLILCHFSIVYVKAFLIWWDLWKMNWHCVQY